VPIIEASKSEHLDTYSHKRSSKDCKGTEVQTIIMSGRGQGRGYSGGRGNAGRRNYISNNNNNKSSKPQIRKTLQDYVYTIGSSKQASDYSLITQFLITHIRKTYERGDDIANALEEDKEPDEKDWSPRVKVAKGSTEEEKKQNLRYAEIIFQSEVDAFVLRKQQYEQNKGKASAFLFSHCDKAMQSKLQARTDYDTIKHEPRLLLKAIKEHSMSYQENKYEMSTIADSLKTFVNLKQKEDESLIDYTRRFKTSRDVLKSHIGGPIELPKYIATMTGYDANDPDKVKELKKEAFEQLSAFIYMDNADKTKYGTLLSHLSEQHSLKNTQPQV
jgi:hypothetical protein